MERTFKNTFEKFKWDDIKEKLKNITPVDVELALGNENRTLEDFLILISPAAAPFLETMATISQEITAKRFGKNIQLYAPLYLSNECNNICTYCGFSLDNAIRRRTLSTAEIIIEAQTVRSMGFQHVLLVSGEATQTVGIDYFLKAVQQIKDIFPQISIEVQPLDQPDYHRLSEVNVNAVLVYQETYNREVYRTYHPKGKKSNFDYRLQTPDRIGKAGIHKIGLGVLLGLEDWRIDSFFTALHIEYLQQTYWRTKYAVSFPRLRPAAGAAKPNFHMNERDLVQLICAYRLWNPDLELSLSTREQEAFRDHAPIFGITSMSAASKTNPGGYAVEPQSLEQFEVSDERPVETIIQKIREAGYQPVWKDWQPEYANVSISEQISL